jgi:hypothetical protein
LICRVFAFLDTWIRHLKKDQEEFLDPKLIPQLRPGKVRGYFQAFTVDEKMATEIIFIENFYILKLLLILWCFINILY